jgi:inner membrane protein involved in colicin E2 resistance
VKPKEFLQNLVNKPTGSLEQLDATRTADKILFYSFFGLIFTSLFAIGKSEQATVLYGYIVSFAALGAAKLAIETRKINVFDALRQKQDEEFKKYLLLKESQEQIT